MRKEHEPYLEGPLGAAVGLLGAAASQGRQVLKTKSQTLNGNVLRNGGVVGWAGEMNVISGLLVGALCGDVRSGNSPDGQSSGGHCHHRRIGGSQRMGCSQGSWCG